MKKYYLLLTLLPALLAGCKKGDYLDIDAADRPSLSAYVSFVNARPVSASLQFWAYTAQVTETAVVPNAASPYLPTLFGNVQINFTEGTGTSYKVSRQFGNQAGFSASGGPNGPIARYYHTVFAARKKTDPTQDTLILFYDNLEAPVAGKAKVRFVHLAPGVPAVSVRQVRPEKDSVLFASVEYGSAGGSILSGDQLQAYSLGPFISTDTGYPLQVRTAQTGGVLPGLQAYLDKVRLRPGGIYTLLLFGLTDKTGEAGVVLIEHAKP